MIGIDIVSIKRFKKIKRGDYRFWKKFFTAKEWKYCFSDASSAAHFAGIFAAKEAIIKAYSKREVKNHSQIEILHRENNKPYVKINGRLNQNIELSISHDNGFAAATTLKLKKL